jgi:hypothetical protein
MPGRKFEESQQIRTWIESALADGADSPTNVLEWIEQRKSKGEDAPALATIGRIMRDMGYIPVDGRWIKKGK